MLPPLRRKKKNPDMLATNSLLISHVVLSDVVDTFVILLLAQGSPLQKKKIE